jgi:hypothetical protein
MPSSDYLAAKIHGLRQEIARLEEELREVKMQELGLIAHETIVYSGNKDYLVVGLDDFIDREKPWLWALPKLKSGIWGQRVRLYSDWEKKS